MFRFDCRFCFHWRRCQIVINMCFPIPIYSNQTHARTHARTHTHNDKIADACVRSSGERIEFAPKTYHDIEVYELDNYDRIEKVENNYKLVKIKGNMHNLDSTNSITLKFMINEYRN